MRLDGAEARIGGRVVWSEVSIEIAAGEFAAILGPNGSGKTTLLRVLLGELALTRGSASVLGGPPGAHKGQIGYLPQRRHFDAGTPHPRRRPRAGSASTVRAGACRCAARAAGASTR